jgi:hypothetical protein
MLISNVKPGNFVHAQTNHFAAPQQLDGAGIISRHSHVVVETLQIHGHTTPMSPTKFGFFKVREFPFTLVIHSDML